MINQRDFKENIWDNFLATLSATMIIMAEDERAQQSAFATMLSTLFGAMCIRMLLLAAMEANRQTIRNNSA